MITIPAGVSYRTSTIVATDINIFRTGSKIEEH